MKQIPNFCHSSVDEQYKNNKKIKQYEPKKCSTRS